MEVAAHLERDAQLMLRVRDGDETSFASPVGAPPRSGGSLPVPDGRKSGRIGRAGPGSLFRIYKSRASYEPTAKFTTWMFRIATHLALNSIRDRKKEKGQQSLDEESPDGRERQVADGTRTVEASMVEGGAGTGVRSAIEALPRSNARRS